MKAVLAVTTPFLIAAAPSAQESEVCSARLLKMAGQTPTLELIDRASRICDHMTASAYNSRTLEANARIYEGQLAQNTVMLWMVVAITLGGVVLAAAQLWATYRLALSGKGGLADGGEISVEAKRLAVRSSVVGVIILALSLIFFTIYVLYVFRINTVEGSDETRSTVAGHEIPS